MADVMRSSHDTADPVLVEALVGDGPAAIAWLEELGCAFTREDGHYRVARCGGASRKRLLQVGDRTGNAIVKALRSGLDPDGVTVAEGTLSSSSTPLGRCLGCGLRDR